MKTIGRIFAVFSAMGMALGFLPLLGWLNWLVIPFSAIGLIFSYIGKSNGSMTTCTIVIILGIIRLTIGGGVF